MVVNYDLPWNPQRIEQRIGRCHRYGQRHDVVVVNFLNKNNAADQRVYRAARGKIQTFLRRLRRKRRGARRNRVRRRVREAHRFDLPDIAARTADIEDAFERLRTEMETNITVTMEDTRRKLLENFDAEVHDRLKINMTQQQRVSRPLCPHGRFSDSDTMQRQIDAGLVVFRNDPYAATFSESASCTDSRRT